MRGLNSDLDSAISRALHSSAHSGPRAVREKSFPIRTPVHRPTYALRRLDIVSETKDSLWSRISALFRADPCLRRLEELEEDLKQKFQRMTVRGLHQKSKSTSYASQDVRLIILGAYNARQTDAAADMSSRQTLEAGVTRQPAESTRTFSSGHSTTAASIGASTDNLHHSPRPEILALGEVGAVDYVRDPIEAVMDWQGRQVEAFKQTGLRKRRTPGVTWHLPPFADDLSSEEDNQRPRRIPTPSPTSRRQ